LAGEEFAIILPRTNLETATAIAEQLRAAVSRCAFRVGRDQSAHCTISIGVAGAPEHGWDADTLLHRADVAVYRAKGVGRDCVQVAPTTPQSLAREHAA